MAAVFACFAFLASAVIKASYDDLYKTGKKDIEYLKLPEKEIIEKNYYRCSPRYPR